MSHHFDTKLAKEDPSLNLCDFYLFDGPSGKTVMGMTVNPDVGLSAPDTLHPEGLYAFRFDLNGDAREEVTFKFRFGEPRHGDGSEHTHIQPFVVRKATGDDALRGDAGESLVEGETGSVATDSDLRVYVARSGRLQDLQRLLVFRSPHTGRSPPGPTRRYQEMPARLGHHNAGTQSRLAAWSQGTLLSIWQIVRPNSR